ncbi:hypothetical protein [Xanthomonas sp. XNM01]|uniref:hypothetical protein n=1 Tax=Xanthomonas sp. XNM01 TaxID=2769289 RepID=UPI00177F3502|nr:hypothetical protein [Xanthomonas sp. XNM01]
MRRNSSTGSWTSRPPAWPGLVLLALWIGWTIPALAALLRAEAHDGDAAHAHRIVSTIAAEGLLAPHAGQPVLLRLDCPCAAPPSPLPQAATLDLRGHRLAAASAYPLLLLDADHTLRYAGPAAVSTGCGALRDTPVPLATLVAMDGAAVVIPEPCRCRGLNA